MGNEVRTCVYVLDPSDPSTWGGRPKRCYIDEHELNEEGLWRCDHTVESGGVFCPFHQPVGENPKGSVENGRQSTPGGDESTVECAGARFEQFDMAEKYSARRFWLPHASVAESLDWSGATVDVSYLQLAGLTVTGPADFSDCVFTGYTSFAGAQFDGEVTFEGAQFRGSLDFRFGAVADTCSWEEGRFEEGAQFDGAEFGEGAAFGGEAAFNRASVRGDLRFENATFEADASFGSLKVYGDGYFEGARFETEPDLSFAEFGSVDRSGIS